jgi:hypothetical protein
MEEMSGGIVGCRIALVTDRNRWIGDVADKIGETEDRILWRTVVSTVMNLRIL